MANFIKLRWAANPHSGSTWINMDTIAHFNRHPVDPRTVLWKDKPTVEELNNDDHYHEIVETPEEIIALLKESK